MIQPEIVSKSDGMKLFLLQVLSVFLVYNKVSVIMASGRELCYVLLLGILASFLIPFFALAKPSLVTCTILRWIHQ